MTKQEFEDKALAMERTLYRTARAMLRQEADQQDAVQEAIAKAWAKRAALRDGSLFSTWLTRILINECREIMRKQKRIILIGEWREDALQTPEAPDLSDVDAALDALPEKLRLPTVLHYMEGFKLNEIAGILRIPLGTVKARLHDARKALKIELEEQKEAWRHEAF